MRSLPLLSLLLSLSTTTPSMVFAAESPAPDLSIAAIVGEEAISSYDVENRIRFIIATTKLSNTDDVVERIRPQIIRSLVDERLQLQEANKNDIKVSDDEIKAAIASIEQQRGMTSGAIFAMLDKSNVPHDTFSKQIEAQLAWNKLVMKVVRPRVKISDEEASLAAQRASSPDVVREVEVSVFNLPVDKPSREAEMRSLADKLSREIREGASFEEVTRQFSNTGGKNDSFWVRPGDLAPAISKAIASAKPGFVTLPVRTEAGYNIVKVYNTRIEEKKNAADSEVLLKEILLRLKADATAKEAGVLLEIGEEVAKHPGSCDEKGIASIGNLDDFDIEVNFRQSLLSALPQALRIIAENLKIGDISSPFASSEGIRLYMLCGKKQAEAKAPDVERVRNVLFQQKMELEVQKYMRDLRRTGFVEIRQ